MFDSNPIIHLDDKELTIAHLYTVDNYFTLNIKVRSGEFAGASNFCLPREKLVSVVESCSRMMKTLELSCEVRDYDSDAHIVFEMDKLGHMFISGQIGGSHEEHSMRFKFTTDQTVLANLLQVIKAIL